MLNGVSGSNNTPVSLQQFKSKYKGYFCGYSAGVIQRILYFCDIIMYIGQLKLKPNKKRDKTETK